jgi:hypothetical protein
MFNRPYESLIEQVGPWAFLGFMGIDMSRAAAPACS